MKVDRLAEERIPEPATMVIFGASGDLTRRKLVPALYSLARERLLEGGQRSRALTLQHGGGGFARGEIVGTEALDERGEEGRSSSLDFKSQRLRLSEGYQLFVEALHFDAVLSCQKAINF